MPVPLKVCFVVLAHHQPTVFHRLLRALSGPGRDIVVHIDRKADIEPFRNIAGPAVRFVPDRRSVYWGGWSLTKAIMGSLSFALKASDADYYILLAGTDFPIRPMPELRRQLEDTYPQSLINHYPLVPGIWGYGLIDRYQLIDLKTMLVDDRAPAPPNLEVRLRLRERVVRLEREMGAHHGPRDTSWIRFFAGSSRWCLTREAARYTVGYYGSGESRPLRRYLATCANSDEIFVQTALLNSPLRDRCAGYDETEVSEIFAGRRAPLANERTVYLHYIDWSAEREDPAILVDSDFDRLASSGRFFASKFIEGRSLPVLSRIEQELLGGKHA